MAYNQYPNTDTVTPIGMKPGYKSELKKIPKYLLLVPKGDYVATAAAGILKATYTAKLKAATGIWYKTPKIVDGADITGDTEKKDFPSGDSRVINNLSYGFDMFFDVADAVMVNLFTLNNKQWDAYIIWANNIIEGRKDTTGTIFWPKRVKEFNVSKRTIPFKDIQLVKATILFEEVDDFQKDSIGLLPTAFDFDDIESCRQVDITPTDGTTTKTANVTVLDKLGEGVEGLVAADFVATGLVIEGAITDSGNGNYVITFTATGTLTGLTLVASASISIDDYIVAVAWAGTLSID